MDQECFVEEYYRTRQGTNCLKWDGVAQRYGTEGLLPLWVADMDFAGPRQVQKALTERVQGGIFGYSQTPENYFESYQGWQDRHFGTQFKEEWLFFATGVVQSLYDLIDCFTFPGDAVIVQSPVYYPFYDSIRNKDRSLVVAPLQQTKHGYQMDLTAFEEAVIRGNVKLFILCSPHNPVGRVWSEVELAAILEICRKHEVLVIADEIHSDFISPGKKFISAISVAENAYQDQVIVCNAPSKTFNMATLLNSHIWIPNPKLRSTFQKWQQKHRGTELSSLGQLAASTAYRSGDVWFTALQAVIEANRQTLVTIFHEHAPQIQVAELEGTYLLWVDLSAYEISDLKQFMESKAGLAIDYGSWFGEEAKSHIRINLATSPENISLAGHRLVQALAKLQKEISK